MSKNILSEYGFTKLYTGFKSTWLRESFALATYFSVYEVGKKFLIPDPKEVPLWSALLAGGLAGVATWSATYPIDYIKTLIQTDSLDKPRHNSMMGYFREEASKGSIKQFFVGFEIMLVRAFFVNAAGFLCFEIGKKMVYEKGER